MTYNFREFRRGDLIVRLRWHNQKGLLFYGSSTIVELPNEGDVTNPVEAHLEAMRTVLGAQLRHLEVDLSGLKAAKEVRRLIEFDFDGLDAVGIEVLRRQPPEVKGRSWKQVLVELHESMIIVAGIALLLVSLAALLSEEVQRLTR